MSLIEKLKARWELRSGWQVLQILLVFACTGYSVILLKHLAGISSVSPVSHRVIFYIVVLPVYNVMLLGYGFLFGQFRFFLRFEKRFLGKLIKPFKKKKQA